MAKKNGLDPQVLAAFGRIYTGLTRTKPGRRVIATDGQKRMSPSWRLQGDLRPRGPRYASSRERRP